jgi:6-phosphogluconolactonase
MLPEVIADGNENLPGRMAALLEGEYRHALAARGRFTLAVPGGSVADRFFPRLARLPLDWSKAAFFWSDERAVPADHPDSNYGAARARWLDPARVPDSSVFRMPADAPDLDRAAAEYEAVLLRECGTPPRLDLVLLGVGPDGHVCSLFTGHPLLQEETRWVAAVEDSPKPPPRRLTLTLPTLAAASLVVVAATGAGKAAVVKAALEQPESQVPLALVVRRARRVVFVLDPAAAGKE